MIFRCCYCTAILNEENKLTCEHLVPQAQGGNNSKENVVPCCRNCNNERGGMSHAKWIGILKRQLKNKSLPTEEREKKRIQRYNCYYYLDYVNKNRIKLTSKSPDIPNRKKELKMLIRAK